MFGAFSGSVDRDNKCTKGYFKTIIKEQFQPTYYDKINNYVYAGNDRECEVDMKKAKTNTVVYYGIKGKPKRYIKTGY